MLQPRETGAYAAVVGGVNIDIGGQSFQPLILSDSNPGRVRTSPGGVGRNIAHNLRLLGLPVRLIAAFGEDLYADIIRRSCREIGIDTDDAVAVPGEATSTYLYLADHTGEMHLAVSDMEICRFLTPDALEEKLPLLRAAGALVLDTNIPEETVRWEAASAPRSRSPGSGYEHPGGDRPLALRPGRRADLRRPRLGFQGGKTAAGSGPPARAEAE